MRSKCQFIGSTSIVGLSLLWPSTASAEPGDVTMSVQNYFFETDRDALAPADMVTLENIGTATHRILGPGLDLTGHLLGPGDQVEFDVPDEDFALTCAIHLSMRLELPVVSPLPTTTATDLAYTGPGTTNTAALGVAALSLGILSWLLSHRRNPVVASHSRLDSILPSSDRERRGTRPYPPLE